MKATLTINYTDGTEDNDLEVEFNYWATMGEVVRSALDVHRKGRVVSSFVLVIAL